MTKISALIITLNEESHIEDVVKSINFADEIIVIDSFSNDGTFEKLKTFENVKVTSLSKAITRLILKN